MSKIREACRVVICAAMGHSLGTLVPLLNGNAQCTRCGEVVKR